VRQPRRLSSRQLALSLECETTILLGEKAREEMIRALADLLLEAIGEVPSESAGGRNESED
jgi:uncharacterized iron-regulated protein